MSDRQNELITVHQLGILFVGFCDETVEGGTDFGGSCPDLAATMEDRGLRWRLFRGLPFDLYQRRRSSLRMSAIGIIDIEKSVVVWVLAFLLISVILHKRL